MCPGVIGDGANTDFASLDFSFHLRNIDYGKRFNAPRGAILSFPEFSDKVDFRLL
jgi:hypothetical protein